MSDTVLRTIDLTKRYKNRVAVDHLNIEVRRGDVFGFLGPNGAGKSTTIRMILHLVFPDRGGRGDLRGVAQQGAAQGAGEGGGGGREAGVLRPPLRPAQPGDPGGARRSP